MHENQAALPGRRPAGIQGCSSVRCSASGGRCCVAAEATKTFSETSVRLRATVSAGLGPAPQTLAVCFFPPSIASMLPVPPTERMFNRPARYTQPPSLLKGNSSLPFPGLVFFFSLRRHAVFFARDFFLFVFCWRPGISHMALFLSRKTGGEATAGAGF